MPDTYPLRIAQRSWKPHGIKVAPDDGNERGDYTPYPAAWSQRALADWIWTVKGITVTISGSVTVNGERFVNGNWVPFITDLSIAATMDAPWDNRDALMSAFTPPVHGIYQVGWVGGIDWASGKYTSQEKRASLKLLGTTGLPDELPDLDHCLLCEEFPASHSAEFSALYPSLLFSGHVATAPDPEYDISVMVAFVSWGNAEASGATTLSIEAMDDSGEPAEGEVEATIAHYIAYDIGDPDVAVNSVALTGGSVNITADRWDMAQPVEMPT